MRFKFTWHQPHTNWERADVEIYALLILLSAYAIPFFYLLSWDAITSAQAICFFFMMTSFLWASFLLKWNFWVCESYILSCNINHQHPASRCYKYNTMTSSSPFLSQGRKTQLLAFFTAHLTQRPELSPLLTCLEKVKAVLFYKLNYKENTKHPHMMKL